MPKKIVTKAALFNSEGTMLVLWRSQNDTIRPGEIDLPGGDADDSEDFAAAMVRETEEETGIRLGQHEVDLTYAFTNYDERYDLTLVLLLFIGKVTSTEVIVSEEHSRYDWMPVDEVIQQYDGKDYGPALQYAQEHGLLP